jgi:hypothetical protein
MHILHYQHWLWFFFISLIMFYFITFSLMFYIGVILGLSLSEKLVV